MDPIATLGWGNRSGIVEGPAAQMVRDAFIAADLVHEDVMSQMGGNNSSGDECEVGVDVVGEEYDSQSPEGSNPAVAIVDGDSEGE